MYFLRNGNLFLSFATVSTKPETGYLKIEYLATICL